MAPDPELDVDAAALPRRPLPDRTWSERVEALADAAGTTPARILVGGAVVAVVVAAGVWVTRPPAAPVEASLPYASAASSNASAPAPTTTSTEAAVVVHVAGAVTDPGVHELLPGARVIDAIEVAGGLSKDADGARLNLAAPVADGQRVYVPKVGEDPPPEVGPGGGSTEATPTGPLDLNTADEAALDELPGVGPATASAIIDHRDRIGGFTSVEQLLDVRGIGEARLESLRDLVRV